MSDLYDNEVHTLLKMGGQKALENQYKNISRRLDIVSDENKELKQRIDGLEKDIASYKQAFEDKCADYGVVSELLGKYQQENEALKKRIVELENFSCQAEQETESLVEQLKQRIAELESKETKSFDEVSDDITIDGYKCKIIKTESGLYISRDEIYRIIDKEKEPLKQKCKELEDRHQSDCIEINRLNTTIDVLIHKVEYLRKFAGLE